MIGGVESKMTSSMVFMLHVDEMVGGVGRVSHKLGTAPPDQVKDRRHRGGVNRADGKVHGDGVAGKLHKNKI